MNITKVSYGKTYSLGNYCSERIDLEASIDETNESVTDAVFQLREYCDQLHKKNNPHLYQEQETTVPKLDGWNELNLKGTWEMLPTPSDTPTQTPKKLSQQELITQEISKASNPKQLSEWYLLSRKFPETIELYDNKLNELTK